MKLGAVMAILIVFVMVGLAVSESNAVGNGSNAVSAVGSSAIASAGSVTPYTYPTTTMQEPGYTNGTYIMAATNNVEHLNVYLTTDVYSFYLLDEIYDSATNLLPNETISPWLATNWSETAVTSTNAASFLGLVNSTTKATYDPLNGKLEPVKYVYTVNIRQGVQWTDWTPANAGSTYTYSNVTTFNGPRGNTHTIHYRFSPMTMKTHYVQSADFILSWKILQSSEDYSGSFANIVNVVPVSNTTVDFYLSNQSATFVTYSLETPILPYHIWVNHDYSTVPGVWNYTASPPSSTGGYNNWNVSYNPTTGMAPQLVGTGPFMMNGGYGMPSGQWIFDQYWKLYVNPHYFVQYTKSLRQWTPKFYELYVPEYLSLSSAVIAMSLNQVYQIEGGVTPTFIPTIATFSHTYIFKKPTTGYGYIQLNSFGPRSAANASAGAYPGMSGPFTPAKMYPPLNITSVRQALNYAVNKVYLNSVVDQGYGIPGTSVVPDSDSVWQNTSLPSFSYNPAKAMQLLNETPGMKYVNGVYEYYGVPFTMNIQITSAASNPLGVEGALLIQKWWDSIGVHTTVTQEAFSTIVSNLLDYGYSGIELGISGIEGDPTGDFVTFYTPAGYGSGFYLGPFTPMNSTTFPGLTTSHNGTYYDNLMTSLYNKMNTNTTLSVRIAAGNEIQGIAAYESTMINVGYGIDLFPIDNSTFVNTTHDTLSQTGFEYWNFMSVHLRSQVVAAPPSKAPEQLSVGVMTPKQVYTNGEYGNVTVQVRNQYGSPVSGANITLGVNPSGALLNITSLNGVTNSNGIYTLEFKVLDNQPLVYTSDYIGEINISAAATISSATPGSVVPGLGYTFIDVQPQPVAYKVTEMPALNDSYNVLKPMQIEVYNPLTGDPISNYSLTLQTIAGIVTMTNVTYSNAALSMVSGNPLNELYNSINYGTQVSNISSTSTKPVNLALTPNGTFAVIVNNETNSISLLNLSSMKISKTFAVGTGPDSVSVAQMTSNTTSVWAFVSNYGSANVTAVNLSSGKTAGNFAVGNNPSDVSLIMNGVNDSFALVTNAGSNNVTAINLTYYVNASHGHGSNVNIAVGSMPDYIAFSGNYALVSNYGSSNVSVINISKLSSSTTSKSQIKLGTQKGPDGMAVVGADLYVAESGSNNVSAIQLVNLSYNSSLAAEGYVNYSWITNVSVGKNPQQLSVSGGFLYASDTGSNVLSAIALSDVGTYSTMDTVVTNISTEAGPMGMLTVGTMTLVADSSGYITVVNDSSSAIYQNYTLWQVTGATAKNGTLTVMLKVGPRADFNLMGQNLESYVFLGNYGAGAPVSGAAPYMTIGQITSATNPNGFGTLQPVELPLGISVSSPAYTISMTTYPNNISSPGGAVQVNVTVVNATGAPVPNFELDLMSQNALGANRGYFSGAGPVIQATDQNQLFGSLELPGIQLTTNSMGMATAMFNAGMYSVAMQNGNFIGFTPQSFTDPYLIPADDFEISAVGVTGTAVTQMSINSSQSVTNVPPSPMAATYFPGISPVDGAVILSSGSTYTLYVNSTYNSPAGVSAGNVPFTLSATYGTFSQTSNTTNSNGTYTVSYTAPKVTTLTEVTITVVADGTTYLEHVYIQPAPTPPNNILYYSLIGVFAALFVIFAALYVMGRRKVVPPPTGGEPPKTGN
ncbi:MAG: ABC transporter substrate-binding protein [Candidatus Thermoplasmatota archaeon]|jgi:hypothetical protein|nr:ABC transporter substrate-binding protein [Candidatus Thermoplasmatota archaeon]WMT43746.1 MAG: ABC transporter substrate-binding protein [Cuniculiplasma divulgatum]